MKPAPKGGAFLSEATKSCGCQCAYGQTRLLGDGIGKAHMERFNVSREIAGYWVRSAAEGC